MPVGPILYHLHYCIHEFIADFRKEQEDQRKLLCLNKASLYTSPVNYLDSIPVLISPSHS